MSQKTYLLANEIGQKWTVNERMQQQGVKLEAVMTVADWSLFSMASESLDMTGYFKKQPTLDVLPYTLDFLNGRDRLATGTPTLDRVDVALAKIDVAKGLTMEESYILQAFGLTDAEKEAFCYIYPRWKQR